jgi:hypothetical protein
LPDSPASASPCDDEKGDSHQIWETLWSCRATSEIRSRQHHGGDPGCRRALSGQFLEPNLPGLDHHE